MRSSREVASVRSSIDAAKEGAAKEGRKYRNAERREGGASGTMIRAAVLYASHRRGEN
jgi:hypothetical protein